MNLTPHALSVIRQDGTTLPIPPSGTVARVQEQKGEVSEVVAGVEIRKPSSWGQVTGIPEAQHNTVFVVSAMCAEALAGVRADVVRPGELVRGADGQPVGCRGLIWAA